MVKRIRFVLIFVVSIACLMQSCEKYEAKDEESDIARLNSMRGEILEMAGGAKCFNSSNCRYISLGVKACGGPAGYLIYSVVTVNEIELLRRVEEYNRFNKILIEEYGWISDCMVVPAPVVGCKDGQCVNLNTQ
jgi:hypothetical protein